MTKQDSNPDATLPPDELRKSAEPIGYLDGNATAFWLICGDAKTLVHWKGQEGSSLGEDASDFDRALDILDEDDGAIEIGEAAGLVFEIGECGGSKIWRIDDGIALWSYASSPGIDRSAPDVLRELGLRVAGLPVRGDVRNVGTVELTSGCLALLVPYEQGCSAEQVASAIESGQPMHLDNGHMLIPVPAGLYDIVDEPLAAPPARECEDRLGRYRNRIRITKRAAS